MPYFLIAALAILLLLAYWELIIAEGTHLGPRVVVWLYDIAAGRYDRIKQFDLQVEAVTLGRPCDQATPESRTRTACRLESETRRRPLRSELKPRRAHLARLG
jgi:hypothetical protein